jgi:hypothetical protein
LPLSGCSCRQKHSTFERTRMCSDLSAAVRVRSLLHVNENVMIDIVFFKCTTLSIASSCPILSIHSTRHPAYQVAQQAVNKRPSHSSTRPIDMKIIRNPTRALAGNASCQHPQPSRCRHVKTARGNLICHDRGMYVVRTRAYTLLLSGRSTCGGVLAFAMRRFGGAFKR